MKLKRDWGGLAARQAEEKHLRVGGERKAGGGRGRGEREEAGGGSQTNRCLKQRGQHNLGWKK